MYASTPFASPFASPAANARRGQLYRQVGVETAWPAPPPTSWWPCCSTAGSKPWPRPGVRCAAATWSEKAWPSAARFASWTKPARRARPARRRPLAQDLDDLYGYLTMRLTLANLRHDEAILDECQRLMNPCTKPGCRLAAAHPCTGACDEHQDHRHPVRIRHPRTPDGPAASRLLRSHRRRQRRHAVRPRATAAGTMSSGSKAPAYC